MVIIQRNIQRLIACALLLGIAGCVQSACQTAACSATETSAGHSEWPANALVVDVRTPEEYASGHLPNAVNIPHDRVEARLAEFGTDKSRPLVVYCKSGRRAGIAGERLAAAGFSNVTNAGGYQDLVSRNK